MRIKSFVARLKFQKRSALKFVSRTIPHSGGYDTPNLTWGVIPVISVFVLITFLSGAFFVPNSFADSKERDEIKKAIGHKKARWTARDTKISQAPSAERKKHLGSHVPVLTTQEKILTTTSAAVPGHLDWRNYNGNSYVTPVKEQGACSDCWAFAVTAALESNKLISSNTPGVFLDLSEQTLNSCSGAGSCSGGYIDAAANFLRDIGLPLESCNPYTATDGMCSVSCSDWLTNPYKISGWYKVNPSIEAIKYALYNYGPVVALMSVYTDFYYYSTGVYEKSWGSFEGYHAVLIVGYDDVEQCFIIKDSWGEDWGEAGYGKIAYGEIAGDTLFGFYTIAYENVIPTGFPTLNSIPRDPNNPNTTGQNGKSTAQLSILTGSVKDESGNAVSSAEIKIGNYKATSSAAGIYVFSSLPAGSYVATIQKSGYSTLSENLIITASTTLIKDFALSSSANDNASKDNKDSSKTSTSGGGYGPGWIHGIGKGITSKEAKENLKARKEKMLAAGEIKASLAGAGADYETDEIKELARALRYDPKLIYDYVHNKIDYVPYYGSLKGAQLTYLDGSGNDFDQASLMIALLHASSGKDANGTIYTAEYVYGQMTIPLDKLASWLGVDVLGYYTIGTIDTAIRAGFIPRDPIVGTDTTITLDRVWVKLNGTYLFDPAFKEYDNKTHIDLRSAMNYQDDLLSTAGGTVDNYYNYTQNLNETSLRGKLNYYTTNLANFIRANHQNSDIKDIIGGRTIIPETLTELPTTLPYSPVPDPDMSQSDILSIKSTLQVAVCRSSSCPLDSSSEIYKSFDTADLNGKRLIVSFNENAPKLLLDGGSPPDCTKCTGSNVTDPVYMTVKINHPYPAPANSQSADYNLKIGGTYAIVYHFGNGISDMLLQKRQKQLEFNRAQLELSGAQPEVINASESVLGETLNIIGQNWLKQNAMIDRIIAGISERHLIEHHNVGVMAQDLSYYIDVKASLYITSPINVNDNNGFEYLNKARALMLSGLEHGILQQLTGGAQVPAVSTIKLLQKANTDGRKVIMANYDTYNRYGWTNFKALFSNYKNNPVYGGCLYTCTSSNTPPGCSSAPACPCENCVARLGGVIWDDTDYTHNYILPDNGSIGWKDSSGNDYPLRFKGYIHKTKYDDSSSGIGMVIANENEDFFYYGAWIARNADVPCIITTHASGKITVLTFSSAGMSELLTNLALAYAGDPVDMAGGSFVYENTDLALGGDIPLGLAFSRSYNSNKNLSKQTLGYGFDHNNNIYLSPVSHAEPVLGSRQPLDTVGMLVAIYACLDLMKATDTVGNWMVGALVANWGIDQLIDNSIVINMGNKITEYIKLADGTYVPPPGITTQLIKNNGDITIKDGDIFSLQERSGKKMNFNALAKNADNISFGKISQIVDADGNTANFTYKDADKKLDKVTDAFGRYIQLNYTGDKITSVSDYATGSTTPMRTVLYSYDTNYPYNLTGYTDVEGKNWSYGYATPANHLITTLTKPVTSSQNITTITNEYDTLGRVKKQTAPRQSGQAIYDLYFSGYRNQEVDPDGHATTYYYDKKGRLYAQEDALGNKVTKTYDGQDHVVSVTDPRSTTVNPIVTNYEYENNNLTKVTNALTQSVRNIYEATFPFRLTDMKDDYDYGPHYNYDPDHPYFVSDVTDALNNKAYSTYYSTSEFPKGFKKTLKDPRGTITTLTYDAYGNPFTAQTTGHTTGQTIDHPAIKYTYDIIGRMTDFYDQLNNPTTATHFEYDKRGLLQYKRDLLGKTTNFTYYDDGLLHTNTDRKGQTITYAYTPTDKIDTITYSDPNATQVKFHYNNLDQVIGMDDAICTPLSTCPYPSSPYLYDAAGRLRQMKDSNGFVISYDYDAAGNLTELTYPSNDSTVKKVTYTYDKLNRLETVKITWLNDITATYNEFDLAGRLKKLTNFNSTITTYNYDNANRLTAINNLKADGGNVIATYQFTELDGNGNRKQIEQSEPYAPAIGEGNVTYGYNDKKNRLESVVVGQTNFTYDLEGQLSSSDIGTAVSYTFDYEHRLKKIGTDTEFFYDGSGKRLKAVRSSVETRYIYDAAGRLLAEANDSNVITRYYIYGKGLLAMVTPADQTYCYHFNGVGSTIAMTDSSKDIVNKYSYDAFGNIASEQEAIYQPFKYVGQFGVMTEPNGFYYMKARYYDPTVGRFISEDPVGFGGGDTNLMAYVGNNPVTGIDPSGLYEDHNKKFYFPGYDFDKQDHGLTAPYLPLSLWLHFQSRADAMQEVNYAIMNRDLDAFERGMHDLQDSYVHFDNGYSVFTLGHKFQDWFSGTDTDAITTAVPEARRISEFYTNVMNSNGGPGPVNWSFKNK
ncbi:MAG: hypothetical protein CVU62_07390 [Deltaproteobacteria bacterium HGW-Deltaproteobacteria-2]|jgi:RHS repeat-associated protein|nr:MAG: hypothetical protein CVU62_07390 [Deltaproteobacteria bacterium HGW-Deltaproteobacteria-2]